MMRTTKGKQAVCGRMSALGLEARSAVSVLDVASTASRLASQLKLISLMAGGRTVTGRIETYSRVRRIRRRQQLVK